MEAWMDEIHKNDKILFLPDLAISLYAIKVTDYLKIKKSILYLKM